MVPKVSVIVPLYNRRAYIQQAMDSVLNQSLKDIEVILLDNQSTDGGYEFCLERYGMHPNVQIIRHKHQMGLGDSRNFGMSLSRGKYIAFLDSDDMYNATGLQTMYEIAEQHNAEVVHASGWLVSEDEHGSVIKPESKFRPILGDSPPVTKVEFLTTNTVERLNLMLKRKLCVNVWSKIYLRDYLVKNEITSPDILNEDVPFTLLNMLYAQRYVRVPMIWNIYRIAPDSLSHRFKKADFLPRLIDSVMKAMKFLDYHLKRSEFFAANPNNLVTFKEFFLMDLFQFHIFGSRMYSNDSLENLKAASRQELGKYFDEHLDLVQFLFTFMNVFNSNAQRLTIENAALKQEVARLQQQCKALTEAK